MSYSKEQITAALLLFEKTGSPVKVQEMLGYPSISMLYLWKEWYPELYNRKGKQWKHATLDMKMDAIRRYYYDGESIQSVAEDIGWYLLFNFAYINNKSYISKKSEVNTCRKIAKNVLTSQLAYANIGQLANAN